MKENEKQIYQKKAEIFKALAHPTRLWIIDQLAEKERCVCELVESMQVDTSTISKHLSLLKQSGIIEGEKRGKWVFYRLQLPCTQTFSHCIEGIIKDATTPMQIIK